MLAAFYIQVAPSGPADNIVREYLTNPFVIIIWAIFTLALLSILRYLRRLPHQYRAISLARANHDRLIKLSETNPEAIRAELLKAVNPNSIVGHRIDELHWISVHGGDFDQVALAEVLAAREGARISIARYAASVLVLLGLCGAVYGLSSVVVQMGPELRQVQQHLASHDTQAEAFNSLLNTMSASLVHTRGAFYASLTGILASVLLLFANWWVGLRQVTFLTQLEDLTATKLIPAFKPLPKETQLAGAIDSFREGSNYLVRLSDDLDNRMDQVGGGLENLFAVVRKFSEVGEALRSNQERVYQAQTQMIDVVDRFVSLTSRIENIQSESRQTMEDLLNEVRDSNKNLARAVAEWKYEHEAVLHEIQRAFQLAHSETKDARDSSKEWIDQTITLIKGSLDGQLAQLNVQALDMLEKQQVGNRANLREVLDDQSIFVSNLQEAVINSDGHREMMAGLAKTISEERKWFSEIMREALKTHEGAISALIKEQKQLLQVSGMKSVEQSLERFAGENQEQFSGLLKQQDHLTSQIVEIGKSLGSLARILKTLIGVAVASIPVFAALGAMYIFNIRPSDTLSQVVSLVAILAMIGLIAFFLRSKL
jgi:hypothetical protein